MSNITIFILISLLIVRDAASCTAAGCTTVGVDECWCWKPRGSSGADVCGYPATWGGTYYSIADNAGQILTALGLTRHPTSCPTDGAACETDCALNVCDDASLQCWGTSRLCLTENQAWVSAGDPGVVRCRGYEPQTPTESSTLSLSSTQTLSDSLSQSLSQTNTISLSVSLTESISSSQSDSLTASSSLSLSYSLTNTLSLSPTDSSTLSITETLTDTSITVSETLTNTNTITVSPTDTMSLSITTSLTKTISRTTTDSNSATESRSLTDSESLSRSESVSVTWSQTPSLSLSLTQTMGSFTWTNTISSSLTISGTLTDSSSLSVTKSSSISKTITVSETKTISKSLTLVTPTVSLSLTLPTPTVTPTISSSSTESSTISVTRRLPTPTPTATWYFAPITNPVPGYVYVSIPEGDQQVFDYKNNLATTLGYDLSQCGVAPIDHITDATNSWGGRQTIGVDVGDCRSNIAHEEDNFCDEPVMKTTVALTLQNEIADVESKQSILGVELARVLGIPTYDVEHFSLQSISTTSTKATTVVWNQTSLATEAQHPAISLAVRDSFLTFKNLGFDIQTVTTSKWGPAKRVAASFTGQFRVEQSSVADYQQATGEQVVEISTSQQKVIFRNSFSDRSHDQFAADLRNSLQNWLGRSVTTSSVVAATETITNPIMVNVVLHVRETKEVLLALSNPSLTEILQQTFMLTGEPTPALYELDVLQLRCGSAIKFIREVPSTVGCSDLLVDEWLLVRQSASITFSSQYLTPTSGCTGGRALVPSIVKRTVPIKTQFALTGDMTTATAIERSDLLEHAIFESLRPEVPLNEIGPLTITTDASTGKPIVTAVVNYPVDGRVGGTDESATNITTAIQNSKTIAAEGFVVDNVQSGIMPQGEMNTIATCSDIASDDGTLSSSGCPSSLSQPVPLSASAVDSSDDDDIPYWLWIILGSVLLLCLCLLLLLCCLKRKKGGGSDKEDPPDYCYDAVPLKEEPTPKPEPVYVQPQPKPQPQPQPQPQPDTSHSILTPPQDGGQEIPNNYQSSNPYHSPGSGSQGVAASPYSQPVDMFFTPPPRGTGRGRGRGLGGSDPYQQALYREIVY
eukprot:TRINITY_DN5384_c1_g3_i1.p1 TRINITY_DN5384_c1_g3~~TRINITY_DN5384_c1_g3_i1.p1  ORF type:complete len:1090 (+),score=204.45 TRINITY_DN5384_c1_g3_i1:55-3324(+)